MNILILPSWFRTSQKPTLGSFFLEQAVAMSNNGHNVTIITGQGVKTKEFINPFHKGAYFNEYNEGNVKVYDFLIPNSLKLIPELYLKIYKRNVEKIFKKILKEQKIDIIHAHSFFAGGCVAVYLSKKYNIPCSMTEHYSALLIGDLQPGVKKQFVPTVNNLDAFACVSESFGEGLSERYKLNVMPDVVPNVLNPVFAYAEPERKDSFTFVSVLRFVPNKRADMIVSAINNLRKEGYDVRLKMVGDGFLKEELWRYVKEYNLEEYIEFLGILPREEIYNLYKENDAFVMVSEFETFGVVYIEALASGRPVIASRNGGANYLINSENGFLVDVGDQAGLENAMREMVDNYSKFDLKKISDDVIAKYSEKGVAQQYERFYGKAIERFRTNRI